MPQPFHNDTFYPVGQVCSPVGKISVAVAGYKCQDALLAAYTSILMDWDGLVIMLW